MWIQSRLLPAIAVSAALTGCAGPSHDRPERDRVQAVYSRETGRLEELRMDAGKDGRPNVVSYMDGARFLRIEVDQDEDGKIDRWEYYTADQKLEKVGLSRANDGIEDAWAYRDPEGAISRIDVSTRRNGAITRTEFYEDGALARAEEDTNGDGATDKWETYAGGALATVSFDLTRSGRPTTTIDYRTGSP